MPSDVDELSSALKKIAGARSLHDPKVIDLLSRWGASSPNTKHVLRKACEGALPKFLREVGQRAVDTYADILMGPRQVVDLLVSLRAPKRTFRTLQQFFGKSVEERFEAATGLRFARPLCSEAAFNQAWRELLEPFQLDPPAWVETARGPLVAVSWPLQSWAEYISSQPDLAEHIGWDSPLLFVVRGDGYPTAGAEWTNLTISLANFGEHARSPSFLWLIGLAAGSEKEMVGLGKLWEKNIEVNT
jgi:hypothetical protein